MDSHTIISCAEAKAQGLKRYFTGKPCKHGHVAERSVGSSNCIACLQDLAQLPEYKEQSRLRNKSSRSQSTPEQRAAAKAKRLAYYAANLDVLIEEMKVRNKSYYERNKEKIKAQTLKYQKENTAQRTKYKREWSKQRAKEDPVYAMKLRLRKMLHRLYNAIQMKRKRTATTEAELGYTAQEAKTHIERQFLRGMTWENHGEWHIDHIVPIGQFDITTNEGRKAANALTNLRPIWAKDNLRKSDAVLTLL